MVSRPQMAGIKARAHNRAPRMETIESNGEDYPCGIAVPGVVILSE